VKLHGEQEGNGSGDCSPAKEVCRALSWTSEAAGGRAREGGSV
jgi:hypothetical protein